MGFLETPDLLKERAAGRLLPQFATLKLRHAGGDGQSKSRLKQGAFQTTSPLVPDCVARPDRLGSLLCRWSASLTKGIVSGTRYITWFLY